jgi:uncharacterized membrane protein
MQHGAWRVAGPISAVQPQKNLILKYHAIKQTISFHSLLLLSFSQYNQRFLSFLLILLSFLLILLLLTVKKDEGYKRILRSSGTDCTILTMKKGFK